MKKKNLKTLLSSRALSHFVMSYLGWVKQCLSGVGIDEKVTEADTYISPESLWSSHIITTPIDAQSQSDVYVHHPKWLDNSAFTTPISN